jgi:hypothetical protein
MSTGFVAFLLYLLVMVDNFRDVAVVVALVTGCIICFICAISGILHVETGREMLKSWVEKSVLFFLSVMFCFSLVLYTFIPDRNGAMVVVAGALGYEGINTIVENERVQNVGGKTFDLMEAWLDEQISKRTESEPEESEAE